MKKKGENERLPEETKALAKGNGMLTFLLDSVRLGNRSDIEAIYSDPRYTDVSHVVIGNRLSFAHMVFQYLSPQVVLAAVNGGMSWVAASDKYQYYINKAQQAGSVSVLLDLNKQMFLDFADSVAHTNHQFLSLVRQCRSYISEHIYEPLSVRQIAEALNISTSYLSHLYKRETGETITDFIRYKKISEAKLLLQYSELTLTDIGEQLGFCSQSHFTDIFHKETGLTPSKFRHIYRQREPIPYNNKHNSDKTSVF